MEQLYRAIVGSAVEPVLKGDELPVPYRQSVHRPLAPQVQADIPGMPAREAEKPITEDPEQDLKPL
jgi:hypothetical protein